ncbi:hypothetical protein ABT174_40835 [Streptomyces sparsogenes]|uniref:hypothetical protein n=1 Tax=Streptomyces sparsogenes TaxID=67365 RepID=UPI00332A317E
MYRKTMSWITVGLRLSTTDWRSGRATSSQLSVKTSRHGAPSAPGCWPPSTDA